MEIACSYLVNLLAGMVATIWYTFGKYADELASFISIILITHNVLIAFDVAVAPRPRARGKLGESHETLPSLQPPPLPTGKGSAYEKLISAYRTHRYPPHQLIALIQPQRRATPTTQACPTSQHSSLQPHVHIPGSHTRRRWSHPSSSGRSH